MPQLIVSFTSYPARIKTVDKVLDSIIKQTVLPDKIILYLSSSQFCDYANFPDFSLYEKFGFEISWHQENLGSHKKYYYAMQQYSDDIIITIDDDFYYKNTMIEELLEYHKKYPTAIITRRAHLVTWTQDGSIAPYEKWYMETLRYIGLPRMDLVATGGSGALYPPHIFNPEIFNKNIFMEKAPYADDLWLKIMEVYSEVPVVLTKHFFDDPGLENYRKNGLYCNQNANGGNDDQLYALLETYGGNGKENYLLRRLASDGKLMIDDCKIARKSDMLKIFDKFLNVIDCQECVLIYGAGNVARKMYRIFKDTGRMEKINAFVVNCTKDNKEELGGIKVRDYRDFISSSEKIIIGLCETKQEEICKNLTVAGIKEERIIKLSPFLYKLITIF